MDIKVHKKLVVNEKLFSMVPMLGTVAQDSGSAGQQLLDGLQQAFPDLQLDALDTVKAAHSEAPGY